ncbi:6-phosphogluconolactonase [Corynebacterium sp. 13CS0277]|uniref:6-phosphogluconolactonase n=1 Tax=Corynebacterium sp. 13CS0277 TaxID=2071994 RepID=UPI000D04699F|nr:6-phosphogluconolactonase [Corynebacterium sp. 13CS0277]PRQ11918.1 6-phosphogluconolactonase [Corynebacterium sp. 13CS0277]
MSQSSLPRPVVREFASTEQLAAQAAAAIAEKIYQAQTHGGVHGDHIARVVVTGGTAGIATLKALTDLHDAHEQNPHAPAHPIDYSRLHVFFGDERNVPVSDPESNEGQARAAWLDHVPVPSSRIHSYRLGELSLEESVAHMSDVLAESAPHGFDLHLLGMGGEGHINSLFPHTPALAERERLVVAVTDSPKPPAERATLTLPAVNSADAVWFLVAGADKGEAVAELIARGDAAQWPAAGAAGRDSTVLFATAECLPH